MRYSLNSLPRISLGKVLTGIACIGALTMSIGSYRSTDTTEVGVRTKKLGPNAGVEQKTYQPGSTFFVPPFANDWHTFDARLRVVEMTATLTERRGGSQGDIPFKTRDGNDINLDIVLSYRIDPQKAPYILEHVAQSDDELEEKVFETIARSVPRHIFGELNTEEFAQATPRGEKAEKVKVKLQEYLGPFGIIVEGIAPKDYRFNPTYAKVITDTKLIQAQTGETNAAVNATVEYNKKTLADAQARMNRERVIADAEYTNVVRRADSYYHQQEQTARSTLIKATNEVAAIRANIAALNSAGGETQVKMKIAESLKGKRIIMVPATENTMNVQTFDLNDFLKIQGLRTTSSKQ